MSEVQYNQFQGIDVELGDGNALAFALLDAVPPVLNVKTFGKRPDLTPQVARELGEALIQFADAHDPVPDAGRLQVWGVRYPGLGLTLPSVDRESSKSQVRKANQDGYYGNNRTVSKDAETVTDTVNVRWKKPL